MTSAARICLAGALLAGLWPLALRASGSVGVNASGSQGQLDLGASASLDLGDQQQWTLSVSDDYSDETGTATPSLTDAATLALDYSDGDAWDSKWGLDYSNDSVNLVTYAGPDLSLTYTHYADDTDESDDAGDSVDADAAGDSSDASDADPAESWALTVETAIHGYTVDLGALSKNGVSKRAGVPYSLVTNGSTNLTQFCPQLSLEVPFLSGILDLTAGYGHDFYDKDPVTVASLIGRRLTVAGGGRLGTVVGALYTDTASASAVASLGAGFSLTVAGTDSQLVSPCVWAQSLEASLGAQWKALSLKAGWTDTFQTGTSAPGLEASAGMDF